MDWRGRLARALPLTAALVRRAYEHHPCRSALQDQIRVGRMIAHELTRAVADVRRRRLRHPCRRRVYRRAGTRVRGAPEGHLYAAFDLLPDGTIQRRTADGPHALQLSELEHFGALEYDECAAVPLLHPSVIRRAWIEYHRNAAERSAPSVGALNLLAHEKHLPSVAMAHVLIEELGLDPTTARDAHDGKRRSPWVRGYGGASWEELQALAVELIGAEAARKCAEADDRR
jgi:hypothetical protein